MRRHARVLIGLCLLVIYAIWVSLGVDRVPFHPDESSLLYQSRDFELWLTEKIKRPGLFPKTSCFSEAD
ncbi:MAG: hypothetical protein P8Z41_14835 [Anaerolineales bacterium]